ncbi:hypothetical protein Daud_0707 [Candidatus Desulforudis audaxviator MP104C]|uniref:Shedu protein SduA C-terminal domain-containing protein n=1 Tax=Desulforudis audaxviator (strain MP104C) TaxID=477974 RepID=B1I2F4_DESAP|nr:Shedu immune nuclease family protein [Candidatus Desulforudis audaxviator]ACA59237.1 hypothetical protein Daud_0707 [Candidatus Desulforudis audaxviator MP104C]
MIVSGPPPISWGDYSGAIIRQWHDILSSEDASDERILQGFLEENPCLLPGPFGWPESGHYPFPAALISQPPLSGLGTKIPDFMWLATNSGYLHPVLIEIETPTKRWFTARGGQHSDLTRALDQLAEWKTWFNNGANQRLFLEYYQVPSTLHRSRTFHPFYVLIHGSRAEFEDRPELASKRAQFARDDEYHMTFDRLTPNPKAQDLICVKKTNHHYYSALAVPPTFILGPALAEYHLNIRDLDGAIKKGRWITEERKDFLISRLPYWAEYARGGSKGIIHTGDWE